MTEFFRLKARDWSCIIFLLLVIIGMGIMTWGKCGHFVKDYGREITHAWKLAEGQVLYQDVACIFGPLGAYMNASIFKLFGCSIENLQIIQLIFFSLFITSLFIFLRYAFNTLTALLGSFAIVSIHGFGFQGLGSTFNFVAPYSHNATYGFYLSWMVAVFLFLDAYFFKNKRDNTGLNHWILLAGICSGLGFQTKSDIVLVCLGVGFSWFLLTIYQKNIKLALINLSLFGIGFFMGHLMMFLFLMLWKMPFDTAIYALGGSWMPLLNDNFSEGFSTFYRGQMGLLYPIASLVTIFSYSLFYISMIGLVLLFSGVFSFRELSIFKNGLIFILLFSLFGVFMSDFTWVLIASPYILINLSLLSIFVLKRNAIECDKSNITLFIFGSLALVYNAKMGLHPKLHHYGFYLSIFSVLVLLILLHYYLPIFLRSRITENKVKIYQSVMISLFLFIVGINISTLLHSYADKTTRVTASNENYMMISNEDSTEWHAHTVLSELNKRLKSEKTFLVLPYGSMLNFFSDSHVPSKYDVFMPPEVKFFTEHKIIENYKQHAPDYVIYIDQGYQEYGVEFGDEGFGKILLKWLHDEYTEIWHHENDQATKIFSKTLKISPKA